MEKKFCPAKKALSEAFELSCEVIKNIELSELPLENIALKVGRLARLLNDFTMLEVMQYEVGGYPSNPNGLPEEIYRLAVFAGREIEEEDFEKKIENLEKIKPIKKSVYITSIRQLEETLKVSESAIIAAKDPDVHFAPVTPYQQPQDRSNWKERLSIKQNIQQSSQRLASRRSFIYYYVLKIYHELKYSGIAEDIFTRIRRCVDDNIGNLLPDSVKKFSAVYDNLLSDNTEDWSNAVHSCRRILQDLADKIFPATKETMEQNGKKISLGKDQYINRIIAFIESKSNSNRYTDLVGSNIKFIGERLDSIFKATQKGSHDNIIKQEEADRYVVYTYLIVGDILSLLNEISIE